MQPLKSDPNRGGEAKCYPGENDRPSDDDVMIGFVAHGDASRGGSISRLSAADAQFHGQR